MIRALSSLVDRTTMYRLVLYYLLVLLAAATVAAAFGLLPYSPFAILASAAALAASCWIGNEVIAWYLEIPTNHESALITALIIALIVQPVTLGDKPGFLVLGFISVWAVASKYVIAWGNKHIFNPAALGVVLAAWLFSTPISWWVAGNLVLLPFVVIGGLLVVWKLRRWEPVLAFFAVALITTAATSLDPVSGLQTTLFHSAFFFLAFAMLTEPLTMPPTRDLRIWYGALVGLFFAPAVHIGSFYFSPALALLIGNAYSFAVSPKARYLLTLEGRRKLAEGIYEFIFTSDRPLRARAGQYLEWTIPHARFDSRGNRRYFTIASAPEESPQVSLGVRFYDEPSGAKRALATMRAGDTLRAGSLSGDFTLPVDESRKLAFIAGGIGVTPFASMARHLAASGTRRDAVLLYSARRAEELAYRDVFSQAARNGLRTVYTLSDQEGPIDAAFLKRAVPDHHERIFYVSGPPGMVDAMKRALRSLGVPRRRIKTDYFPGLA